VLVSQNFIQKEKDLITRLSLLFNKHRQWAAIQKSAALSSTFFTFTSAATACNALEHHVKFSATACFPHK